MIGPAFEACREMQYLPSGAGELTRRRSLPKPVGDLAVMLRAGYTSPHHRRQNASAHRMTSAAVEMMIPSAAFARSRRVGSRASWPMTNLQVALDRGEVGSRLIGLAQCKRVSL